MASLRPGPRDTSVTSRANFARCIAAWPAELPLPTMNTLKPLIDRASLETEP